MNKNKVLIRLSIYMVIGFVGILVYQWFSAGIISWPTIGVIGLALLSIFLFSRKGIQKVIGEYPKPERSPFYSKYLWVIVGVLIIPFTLFILDYLNKPDFNLSDFLPFVIVPILLDGFHIPFFKIPNITKRQKKGW